MARCADTYEAGKGIIIPLIGDDLVTDTALDNTANANGAAWSMAA
jgi:hypothetical protein